MPLGNRSVKLPVFKREIHARLIRRIGVVCLLSALLAVAAGCAIEYRRLNASLLRSAEQESIPFAAVVALAANQPEMVISDDQQQLLRAVLDMSSFLYLEITGDNQRPLFIADREDGARLTPWLDQFRRTGSLPRSPVGHIRLADKRIYQQVVIPLRSDQYGRVVGHLLGVYRLSLADTRMVLSNLLLVLGYGAAAVFCCGLLLYPALVLLHNHLIVSTAELNRTNNFLLKLLGTTRADCGDCAGGHHHRLVIYAVALARDHKLPAPEIRGLIQAAFLHDFDRRGIPKELLQSQEPLSKKEATLLRNRYRQTITIIKRQRWLHDAEPIIRGLHERYDGRGFPAGLSGQSIPAGAAMLALVDRFDTMTIPGPGHDPVALDEALRRIEQDSATRFDPLLVASFAALAPPLFNRLLGLNEQELERELEAWVKPYLPL